MNAGQRSYQANVEAKRASRWRAEAEREAAEQTTNVLGLKLGYEWREYKAHRDAGEWRDAFRCQNRIDVMVVELRRRAEQLELFS
jgi:hypothetical protein